MLETEIENDVSEEISPFDVAIVGMTGRFPGAQDIEEFERNLRDGVCSIIQFSDEELSAAGISETEFNQSNYVRARGWLEDIEFFDARYFGYSPLEAKLMDPQHRIFLEGCVAALENAGYDSHRYTGAISVFAGVSSSPYAFRVFADENLAASVGDIQSLMGLDKDFVTTRASYKLNLKGASFNVQTACSTSLVAVHLACQALLNGQSDMVLAGGVSIGVPEKQGYFYAEGGAFSPDGACRAFDAQGRGVPGGNGMGIVVLKRLTDAAKDRDTIYAVIKGTAINNDGSDKIGFTAPSIEGQTAVITEALAVADVAPETISYVEAHGTATELGDPIEIAALTEAFGTDKRNYCAIGSLKTNIGHLDVAAGVAGLIKTTLAIRSGEIPPSLNFTKPNPAINFAESPFFVNTKLREWKTEASEKRRAGVSSFGLGGTNAHLILEEPPEIEREAEIEKPRLLLLSANSENALEKMTDNLAGFLEKNRQLRLDDVAFTLRTGRKILPERKAVVCRNLSEAVQTLRGETDYAAVGTASKNDSAAVVFMFPGGGAQYLEMARGLYDTNEIFRRKMDFCFDFVTDEFEKPLREFLYPSENSQSSNSDYIRRPTIGLPILFAVEYSLAKLWMSLGVRPEAMIGHSLGEYVAACLAGVFSVADAMKLVSLRAKLLETLPAGAMLNVALSEAEIKEILPENLDIAALNAPRQTLIAGAREGINDFADELLKRSVEAKILRVDAASHTRFVTPILQKFREFVAGIELHSPQIPYISNETGDWIKSEDAVSPDYWVNHLHKTVRFTDGIKKLTDQENDLILLEIGSGILAGLASESVAKINSERDYSTKIFTSLRHPLDKSDDTEYFLLAAGKLWTNGSTIDWNALDDDDDEKSFRVALPSYPFERDRYWIDNAPSVSTTASGEKRQDISTWFYAPTWERETLPVVQNDDSKIWLVFSRNEAKISQFINLLSETSAKILTVGISENFTSHSGTSFSIDPQNPDDYRKLFENLREQNSLPDNIAYFSDFGSDDENPSIAAVDIFCSPLYLLQNWSEIANGKSLMLGFVTQDFFDVTGGETASSADVFAVISGIARTASQEFVGVTSFWADIESAGQNFQLENLRDQFQNQNAGRTVALRGNYGWRQKIQSVDLSENHAAENRLKNGGVYFFTGGLGGLALEIAEELAQNYAAKLILVSRKSVPPREQWNELSTSKTADAATKKILKKLLRIESLGSELLIQSADVADESQLQTAIAAAREKFGRIDGAIHTAGSFPGGMMQFKNRANVEEVFAAKVRGTLLLSELLGDESNFIALFSSINSLTGGFSQSDYCASNAFLDYFALRNKKRKPFCFSINWDTWEETGQALNPDLLPELQEYHRLNLRNKILNSEGKQVFVRTVNGGLRQTIVSVRELEPLVTAELAAKPDIAYDFIERQSKPASAKHQRPKLATVFKKPLGEIECQTAEIWQQLLGIEEIGRNDNFFELGGHSLLATQLTTWVKREFELEIPLRRIFEMPTVAKWSAGIEAELKQRHIVQNSDTDENYSPNDPLLGSLSRQNGSSNPDSFSTLVPLREGNSGAPLFMIHAMSGISSIYQTVTKNLVAERPVFGLDAQGLNGVEAALTKIEEMATHYLKIVENYLGENYLGQKQLYICGWSFGGLIAFEMVKRLRKKNSKIELILIDTPSRFDNAGKKLDESETLVYIAQMFSDEVDVAKAELTKLDYADQLDFIVKRLKDKNLVPPGLQPEALKGYVNVFRANCEAVADYRIEPYEMPLNLIRIKDEKATSVLAAKNKLMGWDTIVGDSINLKMIEGNHYTIIRDERQAEILAGLLDEIMHG